MQIKVKSNVDILSLIQCVALLNCLIVFLVFPSVTSAETICSKDTVCMETLKNNDKVDFFAVNKKLYKVSMQVTISKNNMDSDISFPATFVLSGHEKRRLFSLVIGKGKWNYDYHFDWSRGDIRASHDADYLYRLPFLRGGSFKILQSCNGSFTHFGKSQYAIDFKMPVGTPISAAREGLVVDIKDDSDQGGNSKSYEEQANYVLIEHQDGTIGEYYHLQHKGVIVHAGQRVNKGEILGYSGNTGYSTGPHLDFVVRSTPDGINRISYPVQFSTRRGIVKCPEKNTFLEAD